MSGGMRPGVRCLLSVSSGEALAAQGRNGLVMVYLPFKLGMAKKSDMAKMCEKTIFLDEGGGEF